MEAGLPGYGSKRFVGLQDLNEHRDGTGIGRYILPTVTVLFISPDCVAVREVP
jgi:hypothetical protein